ncbi:MAG: MerR family transcriptional regulator, partial [Clostridia bacterium]|nr:MerR family transcriptional regulator [Clostridia bacterium]
MQLRNCRVCGRVFVAASGDRCPSCLAREEQEYERVRAFLRDRPGATPEEVVEATDVPLERVLEWLREGRLEVRQWGSVLTCRGCGVPIEAGAFCAACRERLIKGLR